MTSAVRWYVAISRAMLPLLLLLLLLSLKIFIKHVQYIWEIEIDAMRSDVYSSKWVVNSFLENEIRMDFDRCIDWPMRFIYPFWMRHTDTPKLPIWLAHLFHIIWRIDKFVVVGIVNIARITIDLLLLYLLTSSWSILKWKFKHYSQF